VSGEAQRPGGAGVQGGGTAGRAARQRPWRTGLLGACWRPA
jgi:hypothetical protein